MSGRDLAWRGAGLAVCAVAAGLGAVGRVMPGLADWSATLGCIALIVALIGVGVLVQGERLAVAWRIEQERQHRVRSMRQRHRATDRPRR